ncbi:MAG: IS200/IS605 family transposase [Ignavibacteriae bacterium]|nr:IS200/IS605 family transposase [Ignavibacteriota bacterium]
MPHSITYIKIHLIFSTKDRKPIISDSYEYKLYNHIKAKFAGDFDSTVEAIGGDKDHIHILFNHSSNYSLRDIVKGIKGESSHWVNENNFINEKFTWQQGYSAFSISKDRAGIVKKYIENQKKHHEKVLFIDEIKRFLKLYGFDEETIEMV